MARRTVELLVKVLDQASGDLNAIIGNSKTLKTTLETTEKAAATLRNEYKAGLASANEYSRGLEAQRGALQKVSNAVDQNSEAYRRSVKDLAQVNNSLKQLETQAERMSKKALRELRESWNDTVAASQKFLGLAAGIGAGLVGIGGAAVQAAARFEQAEIGFTTLLGSGEKAKKFLDELADFSARTPFEFEGLQRSAQQLMAFGFHADAVVPILTRIGDKISAMGMGEFEIQRVIRALGQMSSRGKVAAGEINQLAEVGINGWKALAERLGKTTGEVQAMAQKGQISASEGIKAILASMEKDSKDAMVRQSQTLLGLWSTLKDNVNLSLKSIGDTVVEAFNLKGLVTAAITWMGNLRTWLESGGLKRTLAEYRERFEAIAAAITGALIPAMIAIGRGVLLAIRRLVPFIAIAELIYVAWKNNWFGIREIVKNAIDAIGKFLGQVPIYFEGVKAVLGVIGDVFRSTFQGIQKILDGFRLVIKGLVLGPLGDMVQGVGDGLKVAGDLFTKFVQWIGGKLKPFGDMMDKLGVGIGKGISQIAQNMQNSLGVHLAAGVQSASYSIKALGEQSSDAAKGLALIKEGGKQVSETVTRAGRDMSNAWTMSTTQARALASQVPKITDGVKEGSKAAGMSMADLIKLIGDMGKAGEVAGGKAAGGIKHTSAQVQDLIPKARSLVEALNAAKKSGSAEEIAKAQHALDAFTKGSPAAAAAVKSVREELGALGKAAKAAKDELDKMLSPLELLQVKYENQMVTLSQYADGIAKLLPGLEKQITLTKTGSQEWATAISNYRGAKDTLKELTDRLNEPLVKANEEIQTYARNIPSYFVAMGQQTEKTIENINAVQAAIKNGTITFKAAYDEVVKLNTTERAFFDTYFNDLNTAIEKTDDFAEAIKKAFDPLTQSYFLRIGPNAEVTHEQAEKNAKAAPNYFVTMDNEKTIANILKTQEEILQRGIAKSQAELQRALDVAAAKAKSWEIAYNQTTDNDIVKMQAEFQFALDVAAAKAKSWEIAYDKTMGDAVESTEGLVDAVKAIPSYFVTMDPEKTTENILKTKEMILKQGIAAAQANFDRAMDSAVARAESWAIAYDKTMNDAVESTDNVVEAVKAMPNYFVTMGNDGEKALAKIEDTQNAINKLKELQKEVQSLSTFLLITPQVNLDIEKTAQQIAEAKERATRVELRQIQGREPLGTDFSGSGTSVYGPVLQEIAIDLPMATLEGYKAFGDRFKRVNEVLTHSLSAAVKDGIELFALITEGLQWVNTSAIRPVTLALEETADDLIGIIQRLDTLQDKAQLAFKPLAGQKDAQGKLLDPDAPGPPPPAWQQTLGAALEQFTNLDAFLAPLAKFGEILNQLNPVAALVAAVMERLAPVIEVLMVPIQIVANIIAGLLVPILKMLFVPLKLLGLVVAGVVIAIAEVWNFLTGWLRLFGINITIDTKELYENFDMLKDLTWEQAEAYKKLNKEINALNVPDLLNQNRLAYRMQAYFPGFGTDPLPPGLGDLLFPKPPPGVTPPSITINVNGVTDPDAVATRVIRRLEIEGALAYGRPSPAFE